MPWRGERPDLSENATPTSPMALLAHLALAAPPTEPDVARYLVVSATLLGALILGALLLRRFVGASWAPARSRRQLTVVDALPLGGSKRAVVVRCYDRTFLVGVGDKELCAIAELDAEVVANDAPEATRVGSGFAGLLRTGAKDTVVPAGPPAAADVEARRRVAEELLGRLAEQSGKPARDGRTVSELLAQRRGTLA